jgi:hypothetical protein
MNTIFIYVEINSQKYFIDYINSILVNYEKYITLVNDLNFLYNIKKKIL